MNSKVAIAALRERLPSGWTIESERGVADSWTEIASPDGRRAALRLVERRQVQPRDVPLLLSRARDQGGRSLVVAPFLSPRTRELLAKCDLSYADGTGNLRLALDSPAVFIETAGADRDPNRQRRPLKSLKGAGAGRVVRALCDFVPPYGVRELAAASETPLGTVSRVVSLLREEALLERDAKKRIQSVDWPALIRRWIRDYSVDGSNGLASYLEPRGLSALPAKLAMLDRYAVTGSLVGPSIAPARLAMVYVDDATAAAAALELVPSEAGANVWLLEPFDDVVFERTKRTPHNPSLAAASPSQVAADLLTSPGRGPAEGEALIESMKESESDWRRRP